MSLNPFSYGRPIDDPERFIGRQREIEQIYSRILSACESTSVVGESRTGKTSLLKAVAHSQTRAAFGLDPDKYIFIYQDFQFLDASTTSTRFWQRVLRACRRALKAHEEVVDEINFTLKADTIDNYTLEDIFILIDDADLRVILLLDEFEKVTRNPQFDTDFFGGLRALAIHHNLALVTSSREDLVELTHSEELRSSPFFNIFAAINLRAFSETEATELIDSYLKNTGVKFLLSELNVIFALAGYHPYFLQLACYHLFAAHQANLDDAARRRYLLNRTRSGASPLFQDYWRNATTSQKILLTVMTMRELETEGKEITIEELEHFYPRASQVISELERRTLVTKNLDSPAYHLFSVELREWIADEIVGSTDDLRAWRDWRKDETLIGELPVTLQDMLADVVRGLNPEYREMFANLLLDPAKAMPTLTLVKNFVSRYEHYKESRSKRDPTATMATAKAPVGDTPKDLFARMSRQLAEQEKADPSPPPLSATTPEAPEASSEKETPQEIVISTGRTLKRLKRKATISPIALGGVVVSSIVSKLDLDEADEDFVNGELKWLFQALDHLLKICRHEIERNQPVPTPIPPDAEKSPQANNELLRHLDDSALQSWTGWSETRLEWLNSRLKDLDLLLEQEAKRGVAGKGDIDLQHRIRNKRLEILEIVEEVAQLLKQAYGVFVTSPEQLVDLLDEQ